MIVLKVIIAVVIVAVIVFITIGGNAIVHVINEIYKEWTDSF